MNVYTTQPSSPAAGGKRNWWLFFAGICLLILGFIFLFLPGISLVTMAIWFGAALIVGGIASIASYASYRKSVGMSGWAVVAAILDLIVGIIFILHPILSATVIPWLAAWVLICYGIFEIAACWGLRSMGMPIGIAVANGIVSIICGILFFFFPLIFVYVFGFFLIFRGCSMAVYGASKNPVDPNGGYPIF